MVKCRVYLQLLVLLWLVIEDHDNLFIMAESVHFLGIGLLIYKLMTKKNAGGAPSPLCSAAAGAHILCAHIHRAAATSAGPIFDNFAEVASRTSWLDWTMFLGRTTAESPYMACACAGQLRWRCCALCRAVAAITGAHRIVPGCAPVLQVRCRFAVWMQSRFWSGRHFLHSLVKGTKINLSLLPLKSP